MDEASQHERENENQCVNDVDEEILQTHLKKLMEALKYLELNVPMEEVVGSILSYVSFMKEVLSKKKKLEENEIVALFEVCSTTLQQRKSKKLKDPGSFMIPCLIGQIHFSKALYDLRASINLIPLYIYNRLRLKAMRNTSIVLQFANRSIKQPTRILEDILVHVDKFIFPVDFVILDMKDKE